MLGFFDQATLVQDLRRDDVTGIKVLFYMCQADLDPLLLKDIGKSTLWQPTLQGHLSALKSGAAAVSRARLLSFVPAPRCFTESRAGTSADPFLLMGRTFGRMQIIQ